MVVAPSSVVTTIESVAEFHLELLHFLRQLYLRILGFLADNGKYPVKEMITSIMYINCSASFFNVKLLGIF